MRQDDVRACRVRQERRPRSVELAGQADDEHRLPLELEERDECPARREGRTGDLAQATRGRPLSGSVTAAQSFAGKYVVLQRYVRTRRAWKTVKRVTLRTARAGTAPTMITSAGFRARGTRGARLRLLLTQPQAGACYAPGAQLNRSRLATVPRIALDPKGRSLLDRGRYSHKILTARTHLLNVQPVPYIAVKPLRGNR